MYIYIKYIILYIIQKSHPKDWMKRGRVIVQIKNSDGTSINKDATTSIIY